MFRTHRLTTLGHFWIILLVVGSLILTSACTQSPSAPANQSSKQADQAAKPAGEPAKTTDKPAAAPAKASGPVKIGVLLPFVGPAAYGGKSAQQGIVLGFEEVNNQAAGRQIELSFEDTEGDSATALTKTKKLVEQTGVDLLIGPWLANEQAAVEDYLVQKGMPLLMPLSGPLSMSANYPQTVNLNYTDDQIGAYFGEYAAKKLGYKTAITGGSDYDWGHQSADSFEKGFTAAGGKVVDRVFVPLGTADMSPYITKIASLAGKAEIMYDFVIAEDGMKFHKEFGQFGLGSKMQRVTVTDALSTQLLNQVGPTAEGAIVGYNWIPEMDVPASKAFIDKFKKKYNTDPDWFHSGGYNAAQVVVRALQAVNGDVTDKAAFVNAVLNLKMDDSIFGKGYRFDPKTRAAYQNMYITKVKKTADGRLTREIIDTMTDVPPAWPKN